MTVSCVFCDIARGRIAAAIAHADSDLVMFADSHPIRPEHMQIVPRDHVETFDLLDPGMAARILWLGQRAARAMKRLHGVKRVGFVFSGGDVAHVHAHLVPLHAPTDLTSGRYVVAGPLPVYANAPEVPEADRSRAAQALAAALRHP